MNRTSQFALAVALCVAAANASRDAHAQAVQQYDYQPDRVYQVRTGLGISLGAAIFAAASTARSANRTKYPDISPYRGSGAALLPSLGVLSGGIRR